MTNEKMIEAAAKRARAITPVPGGVRLMITVCLLHNTLSAAAWRRGVTNGKI
jgi:5,10-methylene-tetrahydrofolate dehydrogenase/methenyl tetrahydrofolate cyclohydrolase